MDRELVLAILAAVLCGGAATAAGWYSVPWRRTASARKLERDAWRRIWWPFAPALFLLTTLCGWALVEPASAERVPTSLVLAALPFAAIAARAAWRAWRALTLPATPAVATLGLLRPRIVVAAEVVAVLDPGALAAAYAHERTHVRHRDPLRLWLAQLGSDLLWPWPSAAKRLRLWRQALELARDEEARRSGIAGADLAAAILAALRFERGEISPAAATLGGDAALVEERIRRLLQPLIPESPHAAHRGLWLLASAMGVMLALQLGTTFGEPVVRTLLALA
jgi:Zn-dependent protease with chaperone function